jgi:hypothetical protein
VKSLSAIDGVGVFASGDPFTMPIIYRQLSHGGNIEVAGRDLSEREKVWRGLSGSLDSRFMAGGLTSPADAAASPGIAARQDQGTSCKW